MDARPAFALTILGLLAMGILAIADENEWSGECLYIYIYGRGSRFSDSTSIRIIEFEKKNSVLLG